MERNEAIVKKKEVITDAKAQYFIIFHPGKNSKFKPFGFVANRKKAVTLSKNRRLEIKPPRLSMKENNDKINIFTRLSFTL